MPPPMQPPTSSGEPTNPADIAREAFRLLAKRRIMPTPDAYRTAYEEIAGIARTSNAEAILADFAAMYTAEQRKLPRNVARLGSRFRHAVDSPDLAKKTKTQKNKNNQSGTNAALNEAITRLKQLCFKIELKCDDMAQQYDLLLRLFRLLLENAGELVEDDAWVRGQLSAVQDLLSGPISQAAL